VACRAVIGVLLATAVLAVGAPAEAGERAPASGGYHVVRPNPRLCPSPMCGGIWVKLVNTEAKERYAASADLSRLGAVDKPALQRLITEGRAVARGRLVRGQVQGFPELDTLVVSEVWVAASSRNRARGTFHRLRDRGIRCVTTPCFSIHAAVLNSPQYVDVSGVDLSAVGASVAERRRALAQISKGGLIAAGRIVRAPNGGRTKAGRTFVATQFYVRTPG
jgi:hypothetical protein